MSKTASVKKPRSIHAHQARKRPCLSCGETFRSTWYGHRVCLPCKQLAGRQDAAGLPEQWEGLTA